MKYIHDIFVKAVLWLEPYFHRYSVIAKGPTFIIRPIRSIHKETTPDTRKEKAIEAWHRNEAQRLETKFINAFEIYEEYLSKVSLNGKNHRQRNSNSKLFN